MIGRIFRPLLGGAAPPPPLPLPLGVEVRHGRWLPVVGGLFTRSGRPAAAVTLGDTIVVHPDVPLSERLLRHELAHVRQWRDRPWSFPLRYAWNHLRFGYLDNPYEVAARDAEAEVGTG